MLLARTIAAVAALMVGGCSDGPGPCSGDCSVPIELAAVGVHDFTEVDLADGDPVSIRRPDQGGWVIYVGVRARNVHGLSTQLTAALRGTAGGQVLALEERPVRLRDRGDGWAVAEYLTQDLANLPVCGPVPGPGDFDETAWRLELKLRDADGRTATTAVTIRPSCGSGIEGSSCRCDCEFMPIVGPECGVATDAGIDGRGGARCGR